MKSIAFGLQGGRGSTDWTKSGTPVELFEMLAASRLNDHIPPRVVVNSVFSTGHQGGGMHPSVVWEPFELSTDEYDDFVRKLLSNTRRHYKTVDAPDWVLTENDWLAFMAWKQHGVPLEPYKQLLGRWEAQLQVIRKLESSGASRFRLFLAKGQLLRVFRRMHRFLLRYGA